MAEPKMLSVWPLFYLLKRSKKDEDSIPAEFNIKESHEADLIKTSLLLAVATLNDQEDKLTITQISYRGPGRVLKGRRLNRKTVFTSLVHNGLWMSSSKTLKSTDTYVLILQIDKDIDSLAPQSKGDESRSYKETWNRSAVHEYVTNPTRRHNCTVHESYLKSCADEYNNSGIKGRRPEKNMINQELITNSL